MQVCVCVCVCVWWGEEGLAYKLEASAPDCCTSRLCYNSLVLCLPLAHFVQFPLHLLTPPFRSHFLYALFQFHGVLFSATTNQQKTLNQKRHVIWSKKICWGRRSKVVALPASQQAQSPTVALRSLLGGFVCAFVRS